MFKKTANFVSSHVQLVHRNSYRLLSSKHIEMEKQRFYSENEKSLKLKAKFFLKQMKYTLQQGTKDLKQDTKWLVRSLKANKDELTGYEIAKRRRIIEDLLKFIPYSLIIIIPAAEIFLPAILWLFPNAIPSFYLFDTTYDKKIKQLQAKQKMAYEYLLQSLLNTLRVLEKREDSFLEYQQFHKNFIEIIDDLPQHLDYNQFNSNQLIKVMEFMGGQFYTGTAIINKIVNLFTGTIPRVCYKAYLSIYKPNGQGYNQKTYQDPFFVKQNFQILQFNYFPFQSVKRRFLLWQLQRKFKKLKEQDEAFIQNGMNDVVGIKIKNIARQRGLPTLSCYESLKNVVKNDWIDKNKEGLFSDNNIKLWYSVMLYSSICRNNSQQN